MYKYIIKRNGTRTEFDLDKIINAIQRAFDATGTYYTRDVLGILATKAAAQTRSNTVEDIQNSVVATLYKEGFDAVACAYSEYRRVHGNIRDIRAGQIDATSIINGQIAFDVANMTECDEAVTRRDNASTPPTLGALILNNSAEVTRSYWLNNVYDGPIRQAHESNMMYIHDLSMLSGYCAGWSLKQLITEGIGGVINAVAVGPAKHLHVLCNQMVNFLGIMQNEWAGAQAFSSVDTYLAPFVKVDNLSFKQVKSSIQSLVFGLNMPSRWGCQCPFTNITIDWTVPSDLAELPAIVGGKEMDFKYKDCQREMDIINKAFLEVMIEGDYNGRGFQYPIPTYSITKDFDWSDTENNRLLFEMTAKYGTPYFSNYINSDMEPSDVRSMCCRLRLDLRELRKKNGGYFGSGESTGSIGVVSINMPRIAYLSKDESEFYRLLDETMDLAARSLSIKRAVVTVLMDKGLYPYTKQYLGNFDNHFSTIGLVGMNEAGLNASWLKQDLSHKKTQEFAKNVLNHMRERLLDYQEIYGDLYNLEATPAESTMYRFARLDREEFPDIITAGSDGDTPYYTNSSHLSVDFTSDIFDALDVQDELQILYTSGTVFHGFLGEKLPDWKSAATLVRKIAENYKLPYFTLTPTYSVCRNHGYLQGEHFECPKCNEPAEVYSRITGYYRPIQNWNDGKRQEYKNRRTYEIANSRMKRKGDAEDIVDKTAKSNVMMDSKDKAEATGKTKTTGTTEAAETTKAAGKTCAANKNSVYTQGTGLGDGTYLFTTTSCPNCKIAKSMLDGADVAYTIIPGDDEPELCMMYGIMQAPTLLVMSDGTFKKYLGASDIQGYIDAR